ncbi:hypothetical protein H5201_09480 [Pseudoalteromonas sp. SG43-6]|uniref:hypothetical protein n=1 Tax=Pseudoalteromonas sp. SG43-6 TaxID=2760967 RepID=UPI0015FEF9AE|nr:hypothetical protein [Pseudoalteromonas sp. SG43-6]MBB1434538.1 hypothetical protein [Pseudoalteromonas sp. SG43-6]
MAAFTASQASVTNGSKVVTINSGESIANIRQGDFLFLAGFLVEINRGYVGGSSQQYIELVKNWENSNQSNQECIVIPTTGDFRAAVDVITKANVLVNDNIVAMNDWQTQMGTVTFKNQDGTTTEVKTLKQIEADNAAQMDAYHPFPWAMRKVEFEARRAVNNQKFAASGFVHKGKVISPTTGYNKVASGLWTNELTPNVLRLGRVDGDGNSLTDNPQLNIAGILTNLKYLGTSGSLFGVEIKLPHAEDGTRTYDSATGVSVTHATPAIAFASETETNKVVTERVDMWGFEAFLREINNADPFVYANGLIQSQATSINGVTTVSDNVRPITYFAWYKGDDSSRGKGVNWQTASETQRTAIASDPANKIYFDDSTGKFYQFCARGRSFAGAGNGDWQVLDSSSSGGLLAYSVSSPVKRISPQGISNVDAAYTLASPYYYNTNHISGYRGNTGSFLSSNTAGGVDTSVGVNGECHFLVCGTVNRLNEGAYHPSLNPTGTSTLVNTNGSRVKWLSADSARKLKSKSDCFNYYSSGGFVANGDIGGSITSNFSGRPDARFYDAIYASGQGGVCRDMRYSAWGLKQEDFAEADLAIKSGEYRGQESAVITNVGQTSGYHTTTYLNLGMTKPSWWTNNLNSSLDFSSVCIFYNGSPMYFKIQGFSLLDSSSGSLEGYNIRIVPIAPAIGHGIPAGENLNYVLSLAIGPSLSSEFIHTDVQGSIPDILLCDDLKYGWVGSYLPDLPNGTKDEFALTRPYGGSGTDIIRTHTLNNGVTWTTGLTAIGNAAKNTVTVTNMPTNQVTVWQYKVNAKIVRNDLNSSVYGGVGDVWATSFYAKTWGRDFAYSATGKILTGSSGSGGNINRNFKITDYSLRPITSVLDFTTGRETKHAPIDLLGIDNDVGFKALNYNAVENQQGFINYAYTELKHDGTDWGDDGKIHIVDGQATMLDENGNTVLVGTARCVEPLGWIKNDK